MIVRFNDQMTCQIRQHNRDISTQQGRYIDLKVNPERASELPESKEWPALGQLVEQINKCKEFRTCGCTASGTTAGGHEAPFVDVAFEDKRVRRSSEAITQLSKHFLALDGRSPGGDFVLELCDASAKLPDGQDIQSLRLWLIGSREVARQLFPSVVGVLQNQNIEEYVPIAEKQMAREKQQMRRGVIVLTLAALVWISLAVIGTRWGWVRFGWFGGIIGFIAGVLSLPLLLLIAFCTYMGITIAKK